MLREKEGRVFNTFKYNGKVMIYMQINNVLMICPFIKTTLWRTIVVSCWPHGPNGWLSFLLQLWVRSFQKQNHTTLRMRGRAGHFKFVTLVVVISRGTIKNGSYEIMKFSNIFMKICSWQSSCAEDFPFLINIVTTLCNWKCIARAWSFHRKYSLCKVHGGLCGPQNDLGHIANQRWKARHGTN